MSYRTIADVVETIDPSKRDINGKLYHTYLSANIEGDEFSYIQGFKTANRADEYAVKFKQLKNSKSGSQNFKIDRRFVDHQRKVVVLVEMKNNTEKWNSKQITEQLQNYVLQEQALTGYRIVAILANKENDIAYVWYGKDLVIDEAHRKSIDHEIFHFDHYVDLYDGRHNNKEAVTKAVHVLNDKLHSYSIPEKIRAQFVGTCLLCLQCNMSYEFQSTEQIIGGMIGKIKELLVSADNKTEKLNAITSILADQKIQEFNANQFIDTLNFIKDNILVYINDKTTLGQDLLNLFFTTFNKYVGKDDKNQAFTPDHIAHFLSRVMGVNRNSVVLDPTCGSGGLLVRAYTDALDDCETTAEREAVKHNMYGIEKYTNAYGLAATNMLLHGNSDFNIHQGDCFKLGEWIESKPINTVLMNPPYNATLRDCDPSMIYRWSGKSEDPTSGLHFVYYIASKVKRGKLAVLLPMQCAIGDSDELLEFRRKMLAEHTLDAVFTLPPEMFHPGASVNACCMIFNLGTRHDKAPIKETFFGYFKEDGFEKRKNRGRVEKLDLESGESLWNKIEQKWLNLYFNRQSEQGLSVTKQVTAEDEWLAEAYMETDYSKLTDNDFEQTLRDYLAFQLAGE